MKNRPTIFVLLILVFYSVKLNGQTVVCEGSSCTANDYSLEYFYLGDEAGVPFGPGYCEPGDTVNAHIWTNFVANSAANRYTLYLHFNLYEDDVFVATIDECYYEGLPIPTDVTLDVHNFSWQCGSQITLRDFYMSWRPNTGQSCGCSNSKCYQEAEIIVDAPLIANYDFNPSCLTAYTLQFNSTTSGGAPPYSFLWDFGDGNSSTLENPIHTYTSTGPYTVSLTVQDTENTDSYEVEIVNFDANLPPELYPPPNLNIEGCSLADIPDLTYSETAVNITEAEFNAVGGSLVLSNAIVSLTYFDTSTGTCPTEVTRTFTVIDSCDNSATDVQVFSINDTTLPTASNPLSMYVQCIGDVPVPNINVVTDASDNCSAPIVSFINEITNNNSCPEIITRTYSVTDACGNSINVIQQIIINDDIAPTASILPNISVACSADVPSPDTSTIIASDNCSTPIISFISDVSDNSSCPMTITRTYTVEDDCNNLISLVQLITINDNIAPTATAPPSLQVQCSSDVPAPDTSLITDAVDNCSIPTVSFVSETSNNASCPVIITRVYSVLDDCGNEILLTHDITILDDTIPTASTPAAINVQCVSDVPAPDISIISDATDNCSIPIVSFISDISTGQCPQIIQRTYRVEDDCGNFIDIIQSINVNDDIFPTASNPTDININCSASIPTPDILVVTDETDNCSTPIVAFVSDVSNGACPEVITRTYSVTDECGNSINVTQNIVSTDLDAPTLVSPLNDATVDCDAIPSVPNLIFDDNCTANILVDYSETNTNANNTVDYDIIRVWTVTDNCGNANVFTQNIHVLIANCLVSQCNSCGIIDDTIPPTASNPADLIVACTSSIPPPDINVVTDEADNCVPPIVAYVSEVVSVDCLQRVVRTYSVTDECGNVIYVTHNINVVDNVLPTASDPLPINVSCIEAIPAPDVSVVTDESDNCSIPTVEFVSDVSNNACNQRIIRTYRITDNCGNAIEVTQEINVIDNIAPTANPLTNINVTCINEIPIPDTNVVTGLTDNCSTPSVSFISDISDNNICPETITRTYRITDECGNFDDIIQLISINDDLAPTASNPITIQVACIFEVPTQNINVVTDEADNCSTPTVAFVSDVSDNLTCSEIITRTYSVTDACGNTTNVFQTIIIDDDILPTASNPNTIQVTDLSQIPTPDINSVLDEADNCSIPIVAFVSDVSDNQTCPETILRTFSVTDACNNSINVTQSIIVYDNVAPTASSPSPLNYQCIGDVSPEDINVITDAADNISIATVSFVSESSNNETCPEIITRIYNVTDDCGNSINVPHILFVNDDIPPTASNPATIELSDGSSVPNPDINVVIDEADNCAIPSVAFISEISNNDTCQEILTRTYSVTDDCGNSINVYQDIIITDTSAPIASNPSSITVSCDAIIPLPDVNILNVTSNNPYSIDYVSETSNNETCPEIITRVYRVTDDCGNYVEVNHDIIINDEELPTASNPTPITINHISELQPPNIEDVTDEADNCSIPIVEFLSETSNGDACGEVITRIYSVTDACDNSINVSHTITILDTVNPTASNPESLSLTCVNEIPDPNPNVVTDASDETSTPTISFMSESIDTLNCSEIITRIYNIADNCGNSIDVTHMIYIEDNSAPTMVGNYDNEITLLCESEPEIPSIEFIDNCTSDVEVDFIEEIVSIDAENFDIIRTWTAYDDCFNESSFSQTIHMISSNESTSRDLDLCVTDTELNLMTLVDNDDGIWQSNNINVLDGTTFDPASVPEGSYEFTYTTTTNLCSKVDQVVINVNDNCVEYPCIKSNLDVNISKLLTPNGDFKNENLTVSYNLNGDINAFQSCNVIVSIKIFNRWGNKVYESDNYNNEWAGDAPNSSFGSAEKLPTGTYYYIVNLINSSLKPIQGYVLLGVEE